MHYFLITVQFKDVSRKVPWYSFAVSKIKGKNMGFHRIRHGRKCCFRDADDV